RSLMIDAGSSGTRGGYLDVSGIYVTFDMPGGLAFAGRVKSQSRRSDDLPLVASRLAGPELSVPLRKNLERKSGLVNRKRVYLNGGIVWVMATLIHPEDRSKYVKPSFGDFEKFHTLVRQHYPKFPPLQVTRGAEPKVRERVEADVARMQDIFQPTYRLVAGAEILKVLAAELKLGDNKEL